MKKLFLLLALVAITSTATFAQIGKGEKSVVANAGFQSDPMRFLIGAQGRYNIIDNVRIAPEVSFIFPKDKVMGLDINLNAHYVFDLSSSAEGLSLYPLAGFAMQNYRIAKQTFYGVEIPSSSGTNFGFNLGAGGSYDLSSTNYLNAEMKYTFSDGDCFTFTVGYGFKF